MPLLKELWDLGLTVSFQDTILFKVPSFDSAFIPTALR